MPGMPLIALSSGMRTALVINSPLAPGYSAVTVTLGGEIEGNCVTGALIIPQKATYEIQEKTYVFVVDRKGVIQARNIAISHTLPDLYVIGNGLTEKDRILLEGIQKVKEGDKIHAEFVKPKQVVDQLRLYAE